MALTKDEKITSVIAMMRTMSEKDIAEFIVNLSDSVDQLGKNSRQFGVSFTRMYHEIDSLKDQIAAQQGHEYRPASLGESRDKSE